MEFCSFLSHSEDFSKRKVLIVEEYDTLFPFYVEVLERKLESRCLGRSRCLWRKLVVRGQLLTKGKHKL